MGTDLRASHPHVCARVHIIIHVYGYTRAQVKVEFVRRDMNAGVARGGAVRR